MKRLIYTNSSLEELIISHEHQMLKRYVDAIKEFLLLFETKGYSLRIGLMWKIFPRNTTLFERAILQSGYQCYVYCTVQKGNEDIRLPSVDGEVDYYTVSASWLVSAIHRKFCKLNVELYEDIHEVDADLASMLSIIVENE